MSCSCCHHAKIVSKNIVTEQIVRLESGSDISYNNLTLFYQLSVDVDDDKLIVDWMRDAPAPVSALDLSTCCYSLYRARLHVF